MTKHKQGEYFSKGPSSGFDTYQMPSEKWTMVFRDRYFKVGDCITTEKGPQFRVIKDLSIKRKQWYWRVLHYLTFKLFFDRIYTYPVELVVKPV